MSQAMRVLNAALDASVVERVRLHGERRENPDELSVPEYKAGLKACRDVEDLLEPLRRDLGAVHSRRFDLTDSDAAVHRAARQTEAA